jgi:polyisoprenyl-teichoic acid--peptidoglycan teichoic acid transferase
MAQRSLAEPRKPLGGGVLRMLLGALAVALLAGGATAAIALNEVNNIVEAIGHKHVAVGPKVLAPTYEGGPETLLLVGNDERRRTTTAPVLPHSNEMLLVRIDPSRPTISMLSIPRELLVPITRPDGEVVETRINAAYQFGWEGGGGTAGGIKLMVETIKKVLDGIQINHVFVINFKKFEHAVEELGCIYFPVDKRYYHKNEPGGEQYFEINLKPGYQKLCGKQALEFVANRHESTSLVRDARDQRFMLEVKRQLGENLLEERAKYEHIFSKNVETDLHGKEQVYNLLKLLVQVQGRPVRQVHFDVTLLPTYDTASPEQIHEAVTKFLGGTSEITGAKLNQAVSSAKQAHAQARRTHRPPPPQPSMIPTGSEALDHARSLAPDLPFALEYPRIRNGFAEAEPDQLRLYDLHGPHGEPHRSYVIVIDRGLLGQYYDVEGTTWLDPPLLGKPDKTVQIGSREYSLYYAGEHITTVAWREGNAAYWVQNTLVDSVSPREMIEIAEETQPVDRAVARAPIKRAKGAEAALRLPSAAATAAANDRKIAELLGGLALLALAVLSVLVVRKRREIRLLREQIHAQVDALEAHAKRQRTTFQQPPTAG